MQQSGPHVHPSAFTPLKVNGIELRRSAMKEHKQVPSQPGVSTVRNSRKTNDTACCFTTVQPRRSTKLKFTALMLRNRVTNLNISHR